jgi:hypothetical protein
MRGTCSWLTDRFLDQGCLFALLTLPLPAHVIPGRGLLILDSAVEEAGFLPRADLPSAASSILVGDVDIGGELGRDDLSERRVSEKELSLRLCLGMSTAGVATSAGPSTPVLTIVVVVFAAGTLGDLSEAGGLEFSSTAGPSLLL